MKQSINHLLFLIPFKRHFKITQTWATKRAKKSCSLFIFKIPEERQKNVSTLNSQISNKILTVNINKEKGQFLRLLLNLFLPSLGWIPTPFYVFSFISIFQYLNLYFLQISIQFILPSNYYYFLFLRYDNKLKRKGNSYRWGKIKGNTTTANNIERLKKSVGWIR